jgi:hypothetical protein
MIRVGAVAIMLGLAGCASQLAIVEATPSHATIAVSLPRGDGAVEGGIVACYDFGGNTSPPKFQAGFVEVSNAVSVRSSVVPAGGEYTFVLPQGTYVIVGDDPATTLSPLPSEEVTVVSGEVTIQDLQYYGCI